MIENDDESECQKLTFMCQTEGDEIRSKGCIDVEKDKDCARLLCVNPNGFLPESKIKIENMKEKCVEKEIDGIMLSETNCRSDSMNVEKVKKKIKGVSRNVKILTSDSGDKINEKSSWLPGGIMSVMWGQFANYIVPNSEKQDELRRWNTVEISRKGRVVLIATMHRIHVSSPKVHMHQKRNITERLEKYRMKGITERTFWTA